MMSYQADSPLGVLIHPSPMLRKKYAEVPLSIYEHTLLPIPPFV